MSANAYSTSLPTPTADESQALADAAFCLERAETTAATQLLSLIRLPDPNLLLASLRDRMLTASLLCDDLAGNRENAVSAVNVPLPDSVQGPCARARR